MTNGEKPLADVGLRIVAIIVDTIITGVVCALILFTVIGSALFGAMDPRLLIGTFLGTGLVLAALHYLYFILFEAYMNGQTPGKMLLGIRVVKANGERIGLAESLIRNILRIVDQFFMYLVGFIIIMTNDKRQRIGDMAAGTIVVKV